MKKQNIINLIKYHIEKNDSAFRNEVSEIANDFRQNGDEDVGMYLMDLISTTNYYVPQNNYKNLRFLKKINPINKPLYLPNLIQEDVMGVVRAADKRIPISKILFYGKPGSGKTESAYQIARLLNRDLLSIRMEDLIDSHLGQTSKNIVSLFDEIKHIPSQNTIVLFDEIDALVMNRLDDNDLREMGRVTSTFLRELDDVPSGILIIATTNLIDHFDKALLRRFDAKISFNRYTKSELIEIAVLLLHSYIKQANTSKANNRLFEKMLNNLDLVPYPGEMSQIIKVSLAFSDENKEYDYLRRIYIELYGQKEPSVDELTDRGYTVREIEILTGISKTSVSRMKKRK